MDQGQKKFVFRVKATEITYSYLNHKQSAEPFEGHLRRFFGTACGGNTGSIVSKRKRLNLTIRESSRQSSTDLTGLFEGQPYVRILYTRQMIL